MPIVFITRPVLSGFSSRPLKYRSIALLSLFQDGVPVQISSYSSQLTMIVPLPVLNGRRRALLSALVILSTVMSLPARACSICISDSTQISTWARVSLS